VEAGPGSTCRGTAGQTGSGLFSAAQVVAVTLDAENASQAQFLLGEYMRANPNGPRRANEFLKAALFRIGPAGFRAHAVFRAAEMMKRAGGRGRGAELVERLTTAYPVHALGAGGQKAFGRPAMNRPAAKMLPSLFIALMSAVALFGQEELPETREPSMCCPKCCSKWRT